MKIIWTLNGLTPFDIEHLKGNLNAWRLDIIMTSFKIIEDMDKSLSVKLFSLSKQAKLIFDTVRNQKDFMINNIDELIKYEVRKKNEGTIEVELYISPTHYEGQ